MGVELQPEITAMVLGSVYAGGAYCFRRLLLGASWLSVAAGVLFLAVPDVAIDAWPWTLTPLTARVTGAVVAMYGTVWLAVAVHRTWAGVRIPLQAHAIGLAFLLVAVARGEEVVDWGNPLAVVIVAGAGAMLLTSAMLSRRAA